MSVGRVGVGVGVGVRVWLGVAVRHTPNAGMQIPFETNVHPGPHAPEPGVGAGPHAGFGHCSIPAASGEEGEVG